MQKHAADRIEVPAQVPANDLRLAKPSVRSSGRRRRTRSPHPGVVILRPDPAGRHPHHRARYEDPDTGQEVKVTLDPLVLGSAEARREWAIRKARSLARRRMELESGAPRATGTALDAALKRYFDAHERLRPRTLAAYQAVSKKLAAWARKTGLSSADDLVRAKLMAFREQLVSEPKHAVAAGKGVGRGRRKPGTKPRSPHSVNRELRAARTILGYLVELDLLPRMTHDDLRRALKRVDTSTERIDYRKPNELRKLLEAAVKHDLERFDMTREEHAGLAPVGSTYRYESIAPFVATTLLTGMRMGEVVALDWRQVDLEALDYDGRTVGEIHLTGATKTKRARSVGLEVSPALRAVLEALREHNHEGSVFNLTRGTAEAAMKRLRAEYGVPSSCTWQSLRRTCGTFLTNAPGIFGAASAYRSAKQLGHSVEVAEKHYVDVMRGIPRDARTLEAAMQIEEAIAAVLEVAKVRWNVERGEAEGAAKRRPRQRVLR